MSKEFYQNERREMLFKAYQKAQELLARDEILLDDFVDLYGEENVSRDRKYVADREEGFKVGSNDQEAEHLQLAVIFEAILHEHGEQSNWFGSTATTVKASRFDDIAHGVDEIVEFTEDDSISFLALAVDATYSQFTDKKLSRIKDEIDRGELTKIKYAVAEQNNFRGELTKVPRVIVGVSAETIYELAELWLSNRNKDLAEHPVQFQIVEEIIEQCEVFGKYAQNIGKPEIAQKYERTRAIVQAVMDEKKKGLHDTGKRDDVSVALTMGMRDFRIKP